MYEPPYFYIWYDRFLVPISISLNSFVIYCIVHKTPPEMREYKPLLLGCQACSIQATGAFWVCASVTTLTQVFFYKWQNLLLDSSRFKFGLLGQLLWFWIIHIMFAVWFLLAIEIVPLEKGGKASGYLWEMAKQFPSFDDFSLDDSIYVSALRPMWPPIIDEGHESKSRLYKMLSIFAILGVILLSSVAYSRYPGDREANRRPRNTDDDGQVLLDVCRNRMDEKLLESTAEIEAQKRLFNESLMKWEQQITELKSQIASQQNKCRQVCNQPQPKCPNCVPDSPCPSAWVYSSKLKQCYKHIFDVDFATADRTCRLMNSHLASIHSDEENELLLDLGRAGTTMPEWRLVPLIGGKRTGPGKNDWIWVDGSPFNYTKWSAGQPDFAANVESCLQLWPDRMAGFGTDTYQLNKWNDYVCDLRYRVAICKQPAKY
ncbi:unnamed protein product, partial [Mesorhabditis belari]|uniref:C-type lectin domain-containing protein n=1 Tax=Mesorhabditis belari TaxID=2138241 RepID=A0AAF3ESE2_9BILA